MTSINFFVPERGNGCRACQPREVTVVYRPFIKESNPIDRLTAAFPDGLIRVFEGKNLTYTLDEEVLADKGQCPCSDQPFRYIVAGTFIENFPDGGRRSFPFNITLINSRPVNLGYSTINPFGGDSSAYGFRLLLGERSCGQTGGQPPGTLVYVRNIAGRNIFYNSGQSRTVTTAQQFYAGSTINSITYQRLNNGVYTTQEDCNIKFTRCTFIVREEGNIIHQEVREGEGEQCPDVDIEEIDNFTCKAQEGVTTQTFNLGGECFPFIQSVYTHVELKKTDKPWCLTVFSVRTLGFGGILGAQVGIPFPGNETPIGEICSDVDCPPPEWVLECGQVDCRECPPGTACQCVDNEGNVCCYDANGILIDTIPAEETCQT